MARPLRIQYEGAAYHILSRGNKGEQIFSEDRDKETFLKILQKGIEKYEAELYAYCIMGNHYHLLMSLPDGELAGFMHFTGSSYGSYLRRERGWIGHVFAGRYKSLCVEREGYLLELSRYIHLNPIRAKMVKLPEEYHWSSYGYYIGRDKGHDWINRGWLLKEYGETPKISQRKYREFVEAGIENPPKYPAERVVGQALLGTRDFIKKVLKGIKRERSFGEVTAKRFFVDKTGLDELWSGVCTYYQGIINEGRGNAEIQSVRSQDMLIYLAKEYTSTFNREIAERREG